MPQNWTDEEKYRLIDYVNRNYTFAQISHRLGRSETAVKSMFSKIIITIMDDGHYELKLFRHRNLLKHAVSTTERITLTDKLFKLPTFNDEAEAMDIDMDMSQRSKKRVRIEL